MNDLVKSENTDLITFTDEKLDLIKRTVAKDATDDELQLFLHQAQKMGLDPLARQIHFQKFKSKNGAANVSFITTIDGYRLVADRTGRYAGNSEPVFKGQINGIDWGDYDKVKPVPAQATVTVKKIVGGAVCDFSATVFWHEYYPSGRKGHMWRKMPCVMLAKCAEAAALRKAFPADLSGVYTADEMGQADIVIEHIGNGDNAEQIDIKDGEFIEEVLPFDLDQNVIVKGNKDEKLGTFKGLSDQPNKLIVNIDGEDLHIVSNRVQAGPPTQKQIPGTEAEDGVVYD